LLALAPGTSTGTDGEFELGPLPDGPVKLTARCASGDQGQAQVNVAPGMPETILKVTPGGSNYEIRGLPHATYTVIAEAQRGQLRGRATDIKPDATVDLQALGVTTLSGTVTGPAGPTALFSVELEGPTRAQRSFTDGKFLFGRVDPGNYTVRVQSSDGSALAKVTVTPNQPATLDITLAANAIVVGTLVDAAGKPLAGQTVTLVPDSGDGHVQIQLEGPPPTTGPDGRFRLEHRAEPCMLIVLRPPRPFTRGGLKLEAGKTLDLKTITVDSPAAGSGSPPRP